MDPNDTNLNERFLTLFTANEPAVRAFVRRLVPTRQDAADVMQTIALVLWRKFPELDAPDHFRKWAFGVARYESLAWSRDRARDRLILDEDVLDAVAADASSREPHLSVQRDALEDCLAKLPIEQRKWVLAAYEPDVKVQQIAEQSGRTIGAFYQWLHRIRLVLLECTRRNLPVEELS